MKKFIFLSFLAAAALLSCQKEEELTDIQNMKSNKDVISKLENPYYVSLEDSREQLEKILSSGAFTRNGDNSYTMKKIADQYQVVLVPAKFEKKINPTTGVTFDSTLVTPSICANIFNFEDNGGYAVMSGDSRYTPVLALTTKGHLVQNGTFSHLGELIMLAEVQRKYIEGIDFFNLYRNYDEEEVITQTTRVKTFYPDEGGMCLVKWGQLYPYNQLCPIKDDMHCPTGCVATAVAQYMSIFKYPASCNGYTFDWDSMITDKSDSNGQIASLMMLLGKKKNLDMDYSLNGSGSSITSIHRSLLNFGWSYGGVRRDYDSKKVVDELRNGYPVILGGYAYKTYKEIKILGLVLDKQVSYSSGHAWLAHGLAEVDEKVEYINSKTNCVFKTENNNYHYILCNFGWDGDCDGYYLSGDFCATYRHKKAPRKSEFTVGMEDNYQYGLEMLFGARK